MKKLVVARPTSDTKLVCECIQALLKFGADQKANEILKSKNLLGETALFKAIRQGNLHLSKFLLSIDETLVVGKNAEGQNLLHEVVLNAKDEEALTYFLQLDKVAKLINEPDNHGNTPLHIVGVGGALNMNNTFQNLEKNLLLLLENKADPTLQNNAGETPLHISTNNLPHEKTALILEWLMKPSHPSAKPSQPHQSLPLLVSKILETKNNAGLTPIEAAAASNAHINHLALIIRVDPQQVLKINKSHFLSPVHPLLHRICDKYNQLNTLNIMTKHAISSFSPDLLEQILNFQNSEKDTFLHVITNNDFGEYLHIFLENENLSRLINTNSFKQIAKLAVSQKAPSVLATLAQFFHRQLEQKNSLFEGFASFLIKFEAQLVKLRDDNQNTILHLACQLKQPELVSGLLTLPSVASLVNVAVAEDDPWVDGGAPLHFAARLGDVSSIKLLIEHKANINSQQNASQTTPLMEAILHENTPVVEFFLTSCKADLKLDLQNSDHQSTTDLLSEKMPQFQMNKN